MDEAGITEESLVSTMQKKALSRGKFTRKILLEEIYRANNKNCE